MLQLLTIPLEAVNIVHSEASLECTPIATFAQEETHSSPWVGRDIPFLAAAGNLTSTGDYILDSLTNMYSNYRIRRA